jgi:ribosomal protein L40E
MKDFKELSSRVLEIQKLKDQAEALHNHKKGALEELGNIVYTNVSQGLQEEDKVKETCELIKEIDSQLKEKEGELIQISNKVRESILRLKTIASCDCGAELYEGIKFCYQCGKKVEKKLKREEEKEEKKNASEKVCLQCGTQLPKGSNFCNQCGIYMKSSDF